MGAASCPAPSGAVCLSVSNWLSAHDSHLDVAVHFTPVIINK